MFYLASRKTKKEFSQSYKQKIPYSESHLSLENLFSKLNLRFQLKTIPAWLFIAFGIINQTLGTLNIIISEFKNSEHQIPADEMVPHLTNVTASP